MRIAPESYTSRQEVETMSMPLDERREEEIRQAQHEVYPPPPHVVETANISPEDYERYRKEGAENPVKFWEDRAK